MHPFLLVLLISIGSCATRKEEWKGRRAEEISQSSYFRSLPVKKSYEDGIETRIYLHRSKFPTSAYCQSLGGCMGYPVYNCSHIFKIKEDIIISKEQTGSCP